jgi:hypothetical protein
MSPTTPRPLHTAYASPGDAQAAPWEQQLALLRAENGRLRQELSALRDSNATRNHGVSSSAARVHEMERDLAQMRAALAAREAETQLFSERYVDVEERNCELVSLCTASHRLMCFRSRHELLSAMTEIVVDLIGCEKMGIFEVCEERRHARLLAALGIERGRYATLPLGAGPISHVLQTGAPYLADHDALGEQEPARADAADPITACVPLRSGPRVVGAVAVFELLQQKTGLEPLDHKLFELLSTHGWLALVCTRPAP